MNAKEINDASNNKKGKIHGMELKSESTAHIHGLKPQYPLPTIGGMQVNHRKQ